MNPDDDLILPEPVGKQTEWLDSPASRKVLRIGRRGGKTRFALLAALAGHGPGWDIQRPSMPGILAGGDVVWIAQDYPNLTRVVWREEIKPRFGHLSWCDLNERDHALNIHGMGTLFLVSAEAIHGIRGMGKNVRGIIVDEAAWLALGEALQAVILAILLDNDGWLIIMSTTNAGPDGGVDDTGAPQIPSYFNALCEEIQAGKRSSEWQQFTGTAFDNPTLNPAGIQELIDEYPPGSIALEQEVYAKLLKTGSGLVLPGLDARHLIPPFSPESHWPTFAAFDWGYHHPWVLCYGCADEDGQVYGIDTIAGRLDIPEQIDAKVRAAGINPAKTVIWAGPDIWQARQPGPNKGEGRGPTIAEELSKLGWRLNPADNARVLGLDNLRRYTHIPPDKPTAIPRFRWMDTPGNRLTWMQAKGMTIDPKRPEDALKVDADSSGRGGDDRYDAWRYLLMSRPITARLPATGPPTKEPHRAFPLQVKDGRLVPVKRAPTTVAELVDWAESRARRGQSNPERKKPIRRRYD